MDHHNNGNFPMAGHQVPIHNLRLSYLPVEHWPWELFSLMEFSVQWIRKREATAHTQRDLYSDRQWIQTLFRSEKRRSPLAYRFIRGPRGYTILFWDTVAFDCGIFHLPLSFRCWARQERTGMIPCLRSSLVEQVYGLAVAIEYLLFRDSSS